MWFARFLRLASTAEREGWLEPWTVWLLEMDSGLGVCGELHEVETGLARPLMLLLLLSLSLLLKLFERSVSRSSAS